MNSRIALLTSLLCLISLVAAQQKKFSAAAAEPAAASATVYRNATFGFRYRIPYGWVDRTKEMQSGNDAGNGEVLLAVFERPPEAAGNTINSAVVIAAERITAYRGLKTAADYLGPLTEISTAKGFKAEGDPLEIEIDSRRLLRVDFSKALNEKLVMHQSTLVFLVRGQIVSFTLIGAGVEEVNDLMDGIGFSASKAKAKRP